MLELNNTYHIYNHANGPEDLFLESRNYEYFLQQYQKYIAPIAHTYAYCLMPNHFHILITIKNEEELKNWIKTDLALIQKVKGWVAKEKNNLDRLGTTIKDVQGFQNLERLKSNNNNTFSDNNNPNNFDGLNLLGFLPIETIEKLVTQQFSNFFNSYAKAYNKMYNRRGSLFLKNFRRKSVTSERQLIDTLFYIHLNPIKHRFTQKLFEWPHTSIFHYLSIENSDIICKEILNRFASVDEFVSEHNLKCKMILNRV